MCMPQRALSGDLRHKPMTVPAMCLSRRALCGDLCHVGFFVAGILGKCTAYTPSQRALIGVLCHFELGERALCWVLRHGILAMAENPPKCMIGWTELAEVRHKAWQSVMGVMGVMGVPGAPGGCMRRVRCACRVHWMR